MTSPNTAFTAGQVFTSDNANDLPFGRVAGVVSVTTSQGSITGTQVDITGASITFTAVAGRLYRACWYGLFQSTVADDGFNMILTDASNTIQQQCIFLLGRANNDFAFHGVHTFTPGAGSIVRKIRCQRQYGTGTGQLTAGGTFPFQFWIEDIGRA